MNIFVWFFFSQVKSRTVKDSATPVWNETFTFEVTKGRLKSHKIWISVKNERAGLSKELGVLLCARARVNGD